MPYRVGKRSKVYKVKRRGKSRRKTYKTKGAAKRAARR